MSYESRIIELGITLTEPPKPVASYIPIIRIGDILYLSGMLPLISGKCAFTGKLGKDLTVQQGSEASRIAIINSLSVIKKEIGSLDNIERIIKLTGFVASSEGFCSQPEVINGASNLLTDIFGEAGKHVRSSVGAAELPLNSPVEIELIVKIRI